MGQYDIMYEWYRSSLGFPHSAHSAVVRGMEASEGQA
jgi:hypothetical protein